MRLIFQCATLALFGAPWLGCGMGVAVIPQGSSLALSPVSFSTMQLPGGVAGKSYVASLHATGGSQPYSYAIPAGALPPGLTLHSVGLIDGVPTAAGTSSLTLEVTGASTPTTTASEAVSIEVDSPLLLESAPLPAGTVGEMYAGQLGISGGMPPYAVSVEGGALPEGLTMASDGRITGTPTSAGTATFSVQVRDSGAAGQMVTGQFSVPVVSMPFVLSYPLVGPAEPGAPVQLVPLVKGGTPPYHFTLSSGRLPQGVALETNGTIEGTATNAGISTVTVQATDSAAQPETSSATLTISLYDTGVEVQTTATGATVPATGFGMHTSVYDDRLSDAKMLATLLPQTGITMLRYPGGSYADLYHWAQYTTTPGFTSDRGACGRSANGYLAPGSDFGSFVHTLEVTGTQAIVTVNYGTSVADSSGTRSPGRAGVDPAVPDGCSNPNTSGQPEEAAAWVAYANGSPEDGHVIGRDAVGFDWRTTGFWAAMRAATPLAIDDGYNFLRLGHAGPLGIRYWEIGNEIYYNGYYLVSVENDLHAPYVVTAGGSGTVSRSGNARLSPGTYGGNVAQYLQAMRAVDPSIKIGMVLSAPTSDPIPVAWNAAALAAVCQDSSFDFAIEHYYPGSYNNVTEYELLQSPQVNLPAVVQKVRQQIAQACPGMPASLPVFLTETNANGELSSTTVPGVLGLFAAHVFLSALEAGVANVDWLQLHDASGSYLNENEVPGAAFYGLELAHAVAGVGDTFLGVTSSNGQLLAHATRKLDGTLAVMLLNSSTGGLTVKLDLAGQKVTQPVLITSYDLSSTMASPALSGQTVQAEMGSVLVSVPSNAIVVAIITE